LEEIISLMQSLVLFSKISDPAVKEIACHCRVDVFEKGRTILAQGVPPEILRDLPGSAEVVLDNQDKEKISLALLGLGNILVKCQS
jgi:hypothetical protein